MKKWILLLLAAVDISVAYAQEEFRITGKANGLTDGTLLLLIDEGTGHISNYFNKKWSIHVHG